jgi:hypothetical protein
VTIACWVLMIQGAGSRAGRMKDEVLGSRTSQWLS